MVELCWGPFRDTKSLKISFDSDPKCHHFLDRFKDRFWERFGSILAPSWPPKTFPRWGQVVPRGAEIVLNSNHHRARAPCARLATACGLLKSTSPLASTIFPRRLCFLQHPGLADLFFFKQVLILTYFKRKQVRKSGGHS